MTASPDLFHLIKSLTTSEKRYFKVFASKHVIGNKNNYEKLFDAFDNLPSDQPYDEIAFKQSLKGKKWVNYFAVEKNALEELLLKALNSYHAEKDEIGKLEYMVATVRLLYNKGMVEAGLKKIEKAMKLADEIGALAVKITLFDYKNQLNKLTLTPEDIANADEDYEDEMKTILLLQTERKISNISRRTHVLYNLKKLGKESAESKQILEELEVLMSSKPISIAAKLISLPIKVMIYEANGEFEKGYNLLKDAVAWVETSEVAIVASNRTKRSIYGNFLAQANYMEMFDDFPPIIEKITQLPEENIKDKVEKFRQVYSNWLLYYLNTEKIPPENFIKEFEQGLVKYESQLQKMAFINFRINISILYLKNKHFKALASALNDAYIVLGRLDVNKGYLRDLKFMEAMALVQQHENDLATTQLRNLERWLRDNELKNKFTDLILKLLRNEMDPNAIKITKGQIAEANCPLDLLMLKEIIMQFYL